jgi:uncharacterized protein (TIGR03437 family)
MIPFPLLASARSARRLFSALLLLSLAALVVTSERRPLQHVAAHSANLSWYRGNAHTHTNNSFDGDSTPVAVATAYRELGYNFLFITDHNKLTDVDSVNSQVGIPGQFLVIKGEEVTDSFSGKPVHLIGMNNSLAVAPQHGVSVLNTIDNDVNAIAQAGGIAIVAHPNYLFALSSNDLKSVTGTLFFEIYNAHPVVNNYGDATHSSVEQKWDDALTSGKLLYGLGADDEHTLTNPDGPLPGRAWVMVRAASLDAASIMQAMANGDFYASNGVTLQDYQVTTSGITITLDSNSAGSTVDFIGTNGQLLQRSTSSPATYSFTGHERYVRAKIVNGDGYAAWTQPIFTERLNPADAILNGASEGNEPALPRMVAPDSVALASGLGLASGGLQAQRQADGSFPTTLGGTTVTVNGEAAEVYFVSSTQVTFHVPADTEPGLADVVLTNADGLQMHSQVMVANSAPGVFTEDGTGKGKAVVFDLDNLFGRVLMAGDDSDHRYYVYATGVRGAANLQVFVNGLAVTVEAVKQCRGLPGLDQITIVLPRTVTASGDASLMIQADGLTSNATTLHF